MTIGTPNLGALYESSVGTTSSPVAYPASGIANGDLAILFFTVKLTGNANVTVPTGWTQREQFSRLGNTSSPGLAIFYRFCNGSENGGSQTVAHTNGQSSGRIMTVSGVDGTNPWDVADQFIDSSTGNTTVIPHVSGITSDATILTMAVQNISTTTATPPSGFTEAADRVSGTACWEVAYKQGVTSDPADATVGWSASGGSAGVMLALRPGSGGGGGPFGSGIFTMGTFTQDGGTGVASVNIPVTLGIQAGGRMAIYINVPGGSAGTTFSATDTAGNTWTSRVVNEGQVTNARLVELTATATTGLDPTLSDSVTVNITAGANRAVWCVALIGMSDATGYDTSANASGSGTTAMASGSTASGAQATQYLVGFFGWKNATAVISSYGAGFAELVNLYTGAVSSGRLAVAYRQVNTSGTRSASATLSSATPWAAGVGVFNETPPSVTDQWYISDGTSVPVGSPVSVINARMYLPDGSGGWL